MKAITDVLEGLSPWCVLHGDNTEILPLIPDKGVTHVITDPPYENNTHQKQMNHRAFLEGRVKPKALGFGAITDQIRQFTADECARLSSGWALAFCQAEGVGFWRQAFIDAGAKWSRSQAWVKPDASPQFTGDRPGCGHENIATAWCGTGRSRWNGGGSKGVYTHCIGAQNSGSLNEHPTTKPIALMLELVELFTDPGDIVLDPFCGSGTTGVACIRLGR